jgi:hypothetical protein
MKKLLFVLLLISILMVLPAAALAKEGKPPMDRLAEKGWYCDGKEETEFHCFDPGDKKSRNSSSVNVLVFNGKKEFLGSEILWSVDHYAGQPCPQDVILDLQVILGIPFMACHHYSH